MSKHWLWLNLWFTSFVGISFELPVAIEQVAYDKYIESLAERDPVRVQDFSNMASPRTSVELILLQQAFALGGIDVELKFVFGPAAERLKRMALRQDDVYMLANTVWDSAISKDLDKLWVSTPFIDKGEYMVGFYTISHRSDLLASDYQFQANLLRGVSSSQWVSDWRTLQALPLAQLHDVALWKNMKDMVSKGRADFLLAPFQPTENMSFGKDDVFLPLNNVKVGLEGSRHFVISKQAPRAKELHTALNQGLNILKSNGTIKRALTESGFFNSRVEDWQLVTPNGLVKE